jgi:tetratricopeptide (TPR) repeat protein
MHTGENSNLSFFSFFTTHFLQRKTRGQHHFNIFFLCMTTASACTSLRHRFRRQLDDDDELIKMDIFVRSETSSSELNGDFLWFQLFIEVILRMIDHEKGKQDLVDRSFQEYEMDTVEKRKIAEFAANYVSCDAIKWYTRDCFVYRIINKALRLQNMDTLYAFRRIIIDIYQQLRDLHQQAKNTVSIKHFYRGQLLSPKELEQFQRNIGSFVSIKSFFSTSEDQQMALGFVSERVGFSSVLFDLRVDLNLNGTKPFANVTSSSYYPDEEEVLFMLGTIFRIDHVRFDSERNIWIIELELCSDEDSDLKPSFDSLRENIDEETNLYELGRIFWNMKHLNASEKCFKELLLQKHSNIHIIPGCYLHLGNIAKDRGQFKEAIHYHRQGLELKEKTFSEDHPHIPYSHNSLGEALRQDGNFTEALVHYQKAMSLWRKQYGNDDHENIAMCLHNIGTCFAEQDDLEEALKYFLRALYIMNRCLPSIHPKVALTLRNVGSILGLSGQIQQALVTFKKALSIQQKCLPCTHPDLAETLRDIAISYINSNDPSQAIIYYQQAKAILEQTFDQTHPLLIRIDDDLAQAHSMLASSANS